MASIASRGYASLWSNGPYLPPKSKHPHLSWTKYWALEVVASCVDVEGEVKVG